VKRGWEYDPLALHWDGASSGGFRKEKSMNSLAPPILLIEYHPMELNLCVATTKGALRVRLYQQCYCTPRGACLTNGLSIESVKSHG
jgi:hypothetical protein